jgi:hypothetical protein
MKKIKKKERKEDKSCMSSMAGAIILTDEIFCHYYPKPGIITEKEKALILLQTMVKSTFLNKYSHGTTYLHLNNKIQLGFSPYV